MQKKIKNNKTKTKKKSKRGRPPIKFDYNQIKVFGIYGATYREMADWFGCSVKTIERNMASNTEFSRSYKKGIISTKLAVMAKQRALAMKGDRGMLIWLGKQLLGQKEQGHQDLDVGFKTLAEAIKEKNSS